MGSIFSQDLLISGTQLSGETKESFDQIFQALNQEINFRPLREHHSHTHQSDNRTRSHSLDRNLPKEQISTSQSKLSNRKRSWQCKFCQTTNECDLLICSECGANKVNVYIPFMDRNHRSNPSSTSAPVK